MAENNVMDNNEMEKNSKSLCIQYAEEGLLGAQYTRDSWFVKIKPILSLDGSNRFAEDRPSILFSFVKKGTNGEGFNIYVDIDTFDNWADDVLSESERFYNILSKERKRNSKYPVYYKYVTGNNGEKSVGFAPAEKGFAVINGVTHSKGKMLAANVPISYGWLKTVCKKYRYVSREWYRLLAKKTLANAIWKKKETGNKPPQSDNQLPKPSSNANAGNSTTTVHPERNTADRQPKAPVQDNQKPKEQTKAQEPVKHEILTFVNVTPLKQLNSRSGYVVQAKFKGASQEVKPVNIVFLNDTINKLEPGKWENFYRYLGKGSQVFKGKFFKNGEYYIFEKFM